MKKILILVLASLTSVGALASKARVSALSDSRNINDFQQAFSRPYLFKNFGTMATFEWGGSGDQLIDAVPSPVAHAEGGFIVSSEETSYGLYFGRRSNSFTAAALELGLTGGTTSTALLEQNPLNLIYASKAGDITWGATLKYSSGKDDVGTDRKSSTTGVAVGATNGTWEAELTIGLSGKTEVGTSSVEAKGNLELGLGYKLSDSSLAYLKTASSKADSTIAGTTTTAFEVTATEIGFINDLVATEGAKVFYGVAYKMADNKELPGAVTTLGLLTAGKSTTLPVWIGVEAMATDWMTLRASASQSVLINETDSGTAKANKDNISFAAGAGFKVGKGMIDAVFGTDNNGHLSFSDGTNGNKLLTQVSYTYMF